MDWSGDTLPTAKDIAAYYRQEIAAGHLPPSTRLPASRKLGQKLRVATMTVQSAYGQLREEGLIESRQGSGTYVVDPETTEPSAQATAMGMREMQQQLQAVTSELSELRERVTLLEGGTGTSSPNDS